MRRAVVAALSGLAAAGWMGCARTSQPSLPSGCLISPTEMAGALAHAPGRVTLPDGTSLSTCARDAATDADLQNLGVVMVTVAEDLARRAPRSDQAALQLGYLVGTMRRAMAGDNGVHAELERRLEQALPDGLTPSRRAAYERGISAAAMGG